jgi:hypothetical protein
MSKIVSKKTWAHSINNLPFLQLNFRPKMEILKSWNEIGDNFFWKDQSGFGFQLVLELDLTFDFGFL